MAVRRITRIIHLREGWSAGRSLSLFELSSPSDACRKGPTQALAFVISSLSQVTHKNTLKYEVYNFSYSNCMLDMPEYKTNGQDHDLEYISP